MRLGWVLGACLLVACGDNIVMRYDEFPAAYGEAWCRFQLRCGLLASPLECARFYAWRLSPDLVGALETGATTFDPEAAHECVEWLDRLTCDPATPAWHEPGCYGYFIGTRHDGEACAFDDECIAGECWLGDSSSTCTDACCSGYCVGNEPPAIGKIGDRCAYSPCGEGYCDGNFCVPLLGAGETCGETAQCEVGLSCDGLCRLLPAAGEACTDGCRDRGQMCNGITGVCEQVRQLDQPCYASSDCSPFYHCSSIVKDGRCELIGAGDTCDFLNYGVCPLPLVCDFFGNTCRMPRPLGVACQYGGQCESGICNVIAHVCTDTPCI